MQKVYTIDVDAKQIPSLRYQIAQANSTKQIMMTTWGGLGDQVVAEPTLRYAFKLFPDREISLLASFPELFDHLPFKRIYSKEEAASLDESEWLVLHTNVKHGSLARDFFHHHFTQAVDFCSLCAFQRQLPIADREIKLVGDPKVPVPPEAGPIHGRSWGVGWPTIVIHPGRHWQSKTFPKAWWDEVIDRAAEVWCRVAIVGKDVDHETGTVDVKVPSNVLDLRNRLTLKQLITVLQKAETVITNDSAPLHIAASGNAKILFVASCKEPDHLYHWRNGSLGHRMYNLGRDGLWNHLSMSPIRGKDLIIDTLPNGLMEKILPSPEEVIASIYAEDEFLKGAP